MSQQHVELRLPDLDLGKSIVTACSWHAAVGSRVVEGDRLLEVLAGEVTVDLAAPASGKLAERCVEVDDRLTIGQRLAVIEVS
jgi:pyruvate/2-oxoglutarate dehydrogenase complex dihydrolipoamide acyltransferase (E2) component